jgi:hypothetical protein
MSKEQYMNWDRFSVQIIYTFKESEQVITESDLLIDDVHKMCTSQPNNEVQFMSQLIASQLEECEIQELIKVSCMFTFNHTSLLESKTMKKILSKRLGKFYFNSDSDINEKKIKLTALALRQKYNLNEYKNIHNIQ